MGDVNRDVKTNTAKDWKNRDVTVQILKEEPARCGKSLIENISRIFCTSCNKKFIFQSKTHTFTFQLLSVVVSMVGKPLLLNPDPATNRLDYEHL